MDWYTFAADMARAIALVTVTTALEGDRGCRERVFNKMFDKLGEVTQLLPQIVSAATSAATGETAASASG
jgi:hypothetical protein